jgi:hypothetical protein
VGLPAQAGHPGGLVVGGELGRLAVEGVDLSSAPDGGTVAFTDNSTTITGCGSQPVDAATGKATCQVTYAGAGSHAIVATYSGDTSFQGSFSPQATIQVQPAPTACTTTITGTHSTQLTITSGETCLVNAKQSGQVTVGAGACPLGHQLHGQWHRDRYGRR